MVEKSVGFAGDDPTRNVLNIVEAVVKAAEETREADIRYFEAMRKQDAKYNAAQLAGAVKRLDDIYRQKAEFDANKAETLRLQVDIVGGALGTRVSELERKQSESSGRGAGMTTVIGAIFALGATAATVVGMLLRAH